jgi:hypothetical protein
MSIQLLFNLTKGNIMKGSITEHQIEPMQILLQMYHNAPKGNFNKNYIKGAAPQDSSEGRSNAIESGNNVQERPLAMAIREESPITEEEMLFVFDIFEKTEKVTAIQNQTHPTMDIIEEEPVVTKKQILDATDILVRIVKENPTLLQGYSEYASPAALDEFLRISGIDYIDDNAGRKPMKLLTQEEVVTQQQIDSAIGILEKADRFGDDAVSFGEVEYTVDTMMRSLMDSDAEMQLFRKYVAETSNNPELLAMFGISPRTDYTDNGTEENLSLSGEN